MSPTLAIMSKCHYLLVMPPPHEVGHNELMAAVCLSVCPSPDPKSRVEGHNQLKFGRRKPINMGDP